MLDRTAEARRYAPETLAVLPIGERGTGRTVIAERRLEPLPARLEPEAKGQAGTIAVM